MPSPTKDLYGIIGVPKAATAKEIKKAFNKKALVEHPDRGGDEERFKALNEAYEILRDEKKRKIYDDTGDAEAAAKGQMPGMDMVSVACVCVFLNEFSSILISPPLSCTPKLTTLLSPTA
jgi:DnaJ-class molecular chaperone